MTTSTEFWPWWEPEELPITKRDLLRLLTAALATITVDPVFAYKTGSADDEDIKRCLTGNGWSDPDNRR